MAYEDRWNQDRDRDWDRRDRYGFDNRADRDERYDEARRREEERSFRPFGDVGPSAYGPGDQGRQPGESYRSGPSREDSRRDDQDPRGYGGWYRDYGRGDYGFGYAQGLGAGPWMSYSQGYASSRGPDAGTRYPPRQGSGREHEGRSWWDRSVEAAESFFGGGRQEGPHRGRGPKGYRRSDERIREDVSDRLMDDPFLDASDLEVLVQDCEVTLTGTVATRDDKRRAERLAEDVSGVRHVQNNLRVQSRDEQTTFNVGRADTTRGF